VPLLLIYSITLLAAVLLSERFDRTLLSSTVLFLAVGFVIGPSALNLASVQLDAPIVQRLSDWALVIILFSDALKLGWTDLRSAWRLPGRALFLGLPLTIAGVAVCAHYMLRVEWRQAFLVGAILSPTDPVFASAIVGRREIPARLRHLLNVESGLNDGLALPFVIVLMGMSAGAEWALGGVVRDVIGGVVFGALIGMVSGRLRVLRVFGVAEAAAPLHALATALITYSGAQTLHLNPYLASFSAGVALASACTPAVREFEGLGEQVAQVLKLAAVYIFAVTLSGRYQGMPWIDLLFALVVLTVVRFVAIELSIFRSGLTRPERLTAAWFGPKGFASVVYGLMLLNSTIAGRQQLFESIAVVIVLSIVLHSSTDVPVAKYFARAERVGA
jgi:sodium/hydrogen antiporter